MTAGGLATSAGFGDAGRSTTGAACRVVLHAAMRLDKITRNTMRAFLVLILFIIW